MNVIWLDVFFDFETLILGFSLKRWFVQIFGESKKLVNFLRIFGHFESRDTYFKSYSRQPVRWWINRLVQNQTKYPVKWSRRIYIRLFLQRQESELLVNLDWVNNNRYCRSSVDLRCSKKIRIKPRPLLPLKDT